MLVRTSKINFNELWHKDFGYTNKDKNIRILKWKKQTLMIFGWKNSINLQ